MRMKRQRNAHGTDRQDLLYKGTSGQTGKERKLIRAGGSMRICLPHNHYIAADRLTRAAEGASHPGVAAGTRGVPERKASPRRTQGTHPVRSRRCLRAAHAAVRRRRS